MPAVSRAQRKLFAVAEHHPEQVSSKNKGVLGMSKEKLSHFSSTSEKGLPYKKNLLKKHK